MTKGTGTALATIPTGAVDSITALKSTMDRLTGQANLICPVAQVDHIMAMHGVSLRMVTVDPDPAAGEVYFDRRFCDGSKDRPESVAPSKPMMMKLMAAAGVHVITSERTDDRRTPYRVEHRVILAVRDFDGTMRQVVATKNSDLSDGAPDTVKPEWVNQRKTGRTVPIADSALSERRTHQAANCESKAIHRALRIILNIKQTYTVAELRLPFVVPKLVPKLDPTDPQVKAALVDNALRGEAALYGAPSNPGPMTLPPAEGAAAGQQASQPAESGPTPVQPVQPAADPWDDTVRRQQQAPAGTGCPLPLGPDVLAAIVDAERQAWLTKMEGIVTDILQRTGGVADSIDAAWQESGVSDLMAASFADLAALGRALRKVQSESGGG